MHHYGSTEELKIDMQRFFEAASKIFVFKRVRQAKKHCEVVVR